MKLSRRLALASALSSSLTAVAPGGFAAHPPKGKGGLLTYGQQNQS